METLYTARATSSGSGRSGRVATDDGRVEMDLAIQEELGGTGDAANPEQLFAAGYAACFHSSLQAIARKSKVDLGDSAVTAAVGIGKNGAGFGLDAALEISAPGAPRAAAEDLIAQAHEACPYSNATRGNIDVETRLIEASDD